MSAKLKKNTFNNFFEFISLSRFDTVEMHHVRLSDSTTFSCFSCFAREGYYKYTFERGVFTKIAKIFLTERLKRLNEQRILRIWAIDSSYYALVKTLAVLLTQNGLSDNVIITIMEVCSKNTASLTKF